MRLPKAGLLLLLFFTLSSLRFLPRFLAIPPGSSRILTLQWGNRAIALRRPLFPRPFPAGGRLIKSISHDSPCPPMTPVFPMHETMRCVGHSLISPCVPYERTSIWGALSRLALLRQTFFIPAVLYCLLPQYPRRAAALLHYSSAAPRLEGSIIRQAAVNECECTVTGTGPTRARTTTRLRTLHSTSRSASQRLRK